VPQPQADRLLDLFGNPGSNPDMPGLILPRDPKATWYMTVRFRATGYIKDDDARTWNADEMLASLKIGTDEQNRERAKAGVAQMDVVGWSEPPRYDAAMQRLVWALTSRVMGAKPDEPALVNYNTYALGREGYFTMNMVTALADLPTLKPVAEQQLAALDYNAGKHYVAGRRQHPAAGWRHPDGRRPHDGVHEVPPARRRRRRAADRLVRDLLASPACAGRLRAAGSPVRRNGGRGAQPRQARARPRPR
jgi:hypothetical protein